MAASSVSAIARFSRFQKLELQERGRQNERKRGRESERQKSRRSGLIRSSARIWSPRLSLSLSLLHRLLQRFICFPCMT